MLMTVEFDLLSAFSSSIFVFFQFFMIQIPMKSE